MSTTQCSRTVASTQKVCRKGFTLIELLVVIAIIAILAAILFPVFARARENARRTSCQSNNKQIALGFIQYYQDYDERFPMNKDPNGAGTHWANGSLQPYLKSKQILRCPNDSSTEFAGGADADATSPRVTSYVLNGLLLYNPDAADGKGGSLGSIVAHHLAGVPSPSQVILLAEAPERNNQDRNYFHSFWWSNTGVYGGSTSSPAGYSGSAPGNGNSGRCAQNHKGTSTNNRFCTRHDGIHVAEDIATERHMNGFNVAYLDGHVKWVKWEQVYKTSPDPSGGDIVIQGHFDPRNGA